MIEKRALALTLRWRWRCNAPPSSECLALHFFRIPYARHQTPQTDPRREKQKPKQTKTPDHECSQSMWSQPSQEYPINGVAMSFNSLVKPKFLTPNTSPPHTRMVVVSSCVPIQIVNEKRQNAPRNSVLMHAKTTILLSKVFPPFPEVANSIVS